MDVLTVVKRSHPLVLIPPAVTLAVPLFISEGSYWRSIGSLDDMGAIGAARTSIHELKQSILDAETAQRDYLLTGRKEHLQPFDSALRNIDESFEVLDRRYGNEPKPKAVLDALHVATGTMLAELAAAIRRHDEGHSRAGMRVDVSDIGRPQMDAIRTLSSELLEQEASNVAARPRGSLSHAAARPDRRGGAERDQPAGDVHVPAAVRRPRAAATGAQRLVQSEHDRLEAK